MLRQLRSCCRGQVVGLGRDAGGAARRLRQGRGGHPAGLQPGHTLRLPQRRASGNTQPKRTHHASVSLLFVAASQLAVLATCTHFVAVRGFTVGLVCFSFQQHRHGRSMFFFMTADSASCFGVWRRGSWLTASAVRSAGWPRCETAATPSSSGKTLFELSRVNCSGTPQLFFFFSPNLCQV